MNSEGLLNIYPKEFKFPIQKMKQSSCSLHLHNNTTDEYVAFKVKVTDPKRYCVRPNTGVIPHGVTIDVTITMQALKEAPADMQCKDKFLIQSFAVARGTIVTSELFKKEARNKVEESKFKVAFFIPEKSIPEEVKIPPIEVNNPASKNINIQPAELKFPVQVNKQSSCSLQLKNNTTKDCIAFKVKVTNPRKYWVLPNQGTILPGTTIDVVVMMQALKEHPTDMKCEDKFLIQSVTVPRDMTLKDIASDLFKKEDGKIVEEFKMRVAYELVQGDTLYLKEVYIPPTKVNNPPSTKLNIRPMELKFPFELEEESSCSLQLTNNTIEEYVAFKVNVAAEKQYYCRPSIGVVLPGTTLDVTVVMQAPREPPADKHCQDQLIIQSVTVPRGTTSMDITSGLFTKETGKNVEEFALKVAYIAAEDKWF
ncbi:hypothetical protein ACHQM5_008544 [Ranunculus cassubicifolius]